MIVVITAERTYSIDGCGADWQYLAKGGGWTVKPEEIRTFESTEEAEEFLRTNPQPREGNDGMLIVEGPIVKTFG